MYASVDHFTGENQKKRIRELEAAAKYPAATGTAVALPTPNSDTDQGIAEFIGEGCLSTSPKPVSSSGCDDSTSFADGTSEDAVWSTYSTTVEARISGSLRGFTEDFGCNQTPLHLAILSGNSSMIKLLLTKGADISRQDSHGSSVLHFAVASKEVHIVKLLLQEVGHPDDTNSNGRTPLFLAVQNGDKEIVRLLLDASADANLKDIWGKSPLHVAVEMGSEQMALLLLERGAHIDS